MKEVKSLVKDALSDPDHPLFSLHERSEKYHPEIYKMFLVQWSVSGMSRTFSIIFQN